MGVSGVPWKCEKSRIIEALKRNKGVMTRTCAELDCDYTTLKKRINADPELIEILSDARHTFDNTLLDMAENTLMYAMGLQKTEIHAALKASFYALNNKGRERGYQRIKGDDDGSETPVEALKKALRELSGSTPPEESTVEDQPSLLDQGQAGKQGEV